MRHPRRGAIVVTATIVCLALSAALATAGPAAADSVYRSQHIPLSAAGSAPLATGFVENIHVNGPRVFALERYVLVGAAPSTEYQVTIQIYGDPGANVSLGAMPTIAFKTNGVGNGVGRFTLPFSAVADELHGLTLYLVWELTTEGAVAYQTAVSMVVLD